MTYTLTVTNNGTASATGVTLTDTLPSGAAFVSATGGAKPTGGVLTFTLGDLAAGADSKVTIVVTPAAAGSLNDVAKVSMDQTEPNPANSTVTLSTTVTSAGGTQGTTSPTATPAAPTPSPTPAAPTPSPTIQSVQRFGFHTIPTKFVLMFDAALNPARADEAASYRLVDMDRPRESIRFRSATYNAADRSVTLRPTHRLYLYDHYRLTVASPRSMAVTAAAGGDPAGGNFVATITPADLVLTPAQRRDGPLMSLIRSLAVKFPGLAHLVGGPASRPGA